MPQVDNAPAGLNSLLDKGYRGALTTYKGDQKKAAATAWTAAKGAGWHKDKSGSWKKKGESESSYYQWHNFWKQIDYRSADQSYQSRERNLLEALGMPTQDTGLIPFRAKILLAVPGTSLNQREY